MKVEIYTTPYCPFCIKAKRLLDRKGAQYEEYDVQGAQDKSKMIDRSNGSKTVPQIFIDAIHIGGCDDLYELDYQDKLDNLLNK